MGYAMYFVKAGLLSIGGSYLESNYFPNFFPGMVESSTALAGQTKAFSLVIFSMAAYNFWLFMHGMGVGSARRKFMEKAKKDGEKDVDARYSMPNLYVAGNTANSKAFNCHQRSHQQQLETVSLFNFSMLLSGLVFPVTSAFTGFMYLFSRRAWTNGYANDEGNAMKRYSHPLAKEVWTLLLSQIILMGLVGFKIGGFFNYW